MARRETYSNGSAGPNWLRAPEGIEIICLGSLIRYAYAGTYILLRDSHSNVPASVCIPSGARNVAHGQGQDMYWPLTGSTQLSHHVSVAA